MSFQSNNSDEEKEDKNENKPSVWPQVNEHKGYFCN